MPKFPKIPGYYLRLAAFFLICGLIALLVFIFFINPMANEYYTVEVDYAYAAPVLGVVVDGQMQILKVEAGSAAEKAGLKQGDVLTSLDGGTITSSGQLKQRMLTKFRNPTGEIFTDPGASSTFKIGYTRQNQPSEVTAILIPAVITANSGPTPTAVPANQDYL